jgi:chaperonin GroES
MNQQELTETPDATFTTTKPPVGPGVITQDQPAQTPEEISPATQYERAMDALNAYHAMLNIATELDESKLNQIAERVLRDYTIDMDSTADWRKRIDEIIKFAKLLVDVKTWGGDIVANVRFPMIAQGAINFNARAYPEIVKGKEVVKFAVAGADKQGLKAARANRVSQHMNYQVMNEMEEWEEEEDKMLLLLPVMGCAFKKTYYDAVKRRNVSELVFPDDLVVNYWAKNIETAMRITQIIRLTRNEIVERINAEVFLGIDVKILGQPIADEKDKSSGTDEDAPHTFLEQHRWLDLDGDGYDEPYIVTVHKDTRRIVRIAARYDLDGIESNNDGEIVRIEPVHYYTRFPFMPSIDGGFYCEGFGTLMFSMNNAVDDGVNQLLDAGSALNRPSGFIASGVNLGRGRGGTSIQLKRGEWKTVQNSGDDLRKGIVEAPVPQPSPVTLKMLDTLINVGKELTMSAAILSGESPGANVPAATTLALIEQGLKPISGVFKRIFRAHKSEFDKLVRLNRLYLADEDYKRVLDDPEATKDDYNSKDCDVYPILDPNNASDSLRIMKAQALMQMKGQGFNDEEINRRYVEALNVENVDKILPEEGAQDPAKDAQAQMAQLAMKKLEADINLTNEQAATQRVDQFVKLKGVDFDKAMLILKAAQTNITMNKDQKNAELKGLEVQGKFLGSEATPGATGSGASPRLWSPGPGSSPAPSTTEAEQPSAATTQGPYVEKGMRSNNLENAGMPAEIGEGV